jgi:glycosyltransferase involved in cell wall biosynthesis
MSFTKKVSWICFAFNAKPTSMRRAIAERLAENEPVVIVNRPVSVLREHLVPPLKARCNRLPGGEGCWDYRPLHYTERLPGIGRVLKLLNRRNIQRELNQLLKANAKRIACYDSPTQEHLVGKLGESLSVYTAIDDLTITVTGSPIRGELEAEKHLLGRVDLVICVSEMLAQRLRERSPSPEKPPIHVLPNGYDERIFNPKGNYPELNALRRIPRPRILVAGHVSERIDWDGIIEASQLRPQWTWIFIGPADKGMKEKIINALGKNGYYHPSIRAQDTPAWIEHCNVCAVPYRLNPFTLTSHPLKAIEYLAMGAPVLSTRIPSLERYDAAIEWVNEGSGESYVRALDKLGNQSKSQDLRIFRQQTVARDSWALRVSQFRMIVLDQTDTPR